MFVTESVIHERRIGPGDLVFMVGLFTRMTGKRKLAMGLPSHASMRTPCNSFPSLRDAIAVGGTLPPCYLIGAEHRTALVDLLQGSAIASGLENLRGRSVLIA